MSKFFASGLFLFFLWLGSANANHQVEGDLEALSGDLSPYSMENGGRKGFFVEVFLEIEKRLERHTPLHFLPWTRAQRVAKTQKNKLIFPLTRTPEREKNYSWIIEVAPIDFVFVTKGKRKLTLDEARQLPWVTVQTATPFEQFLRQEKFTNIVVSPHPSLMHIRLLDRERVDAWFTARSFADYTLRFYGEKKFTVSPSVKKSSLYIAASKDFPQNLIEDYRRIYREMQADGTIKRIMRSYGLDYESK